MSQNRRLIADQKAIDSPRLTLARSADAVHRTRIDDWQRGIHRVGTASGALRPWQAVTGGSGMVLRAASTLRTEPAPLHSEFALLDASIDPDARSFLASDGSWCAIALVERSRPLSGALPSPGAATPALAYIPTVRTLLSRTAWTLLSCYVLRQPPRGILARHVDPQAVHLQECRLLVPIQAPTCCRDLDRARGSRLSRRHRLDGRFQLPALSGKRGGCAARRARHRSAVRARRTTIAASGVGGCCLTPSRTGARSMPPPAPVACRRERGRSALDGTPVGRFRRLSNPAPIIRRRPARYDTVTAEVTRAPTVVAPAPCARLQR